MKRKYINCKTQGESYHPELNLKDVLTYLQQTREIRDAFKKNVLVFL